MTTVGHDIADLFHLFVAVLLLLLVCTSSKIELVQRNPLIFLDSPVDVVHKHSLLCNVDIAHLSVVPVLVPEHLTNKRMSGSL
jgi:hypothetical protein